MTSASKKQKIKHNIVTDGNEKFALDKCKGLYMFHKQNRVANKKMCEEPTPEELEDWIDEGNREIYGG